MRPRTYFGLEHVEPEPRSFLTVGSFDGLHRGHRRILEELRRQAKAHNSSSTVVTFDPHSQLVINRPGKPAIQILTTIEEKQTLLHAAGIDRIVVIPFTREFSRTSSERFVRDILYQTIGMQGIIIGHDHGFGKNREGDVATLMCLGRELGFTVDEVPPLENDGVLISSTAIRRRLLEGDIEQANRWLGMAYRLTAEVVPGAGRGHVMNFPTANLEPVNRHKLIPAHGVYAVKATCGDQEYEGMMNIGVRPTFAGTSRTLEVHLFDCDRDLYGELLEVQFLSRIRSERKFESVEALTAQLHQDKKASLHALRSQPRAG